MAGSLIGKNVGNYKVIAKIGEGGMGSVYLGEHPLIGKKVAIKVLHEDLATKEDVVSRFFTEARAVTAIGHPNIVDVSDFGVLNDPDSGDIAYIVMEFLDGEPLNARLKREGVTMQEAVHIAEQVASALAASHNKQIIHRDLKPENVYLVTRGGDRNYVKILDFGIAKLTGDQGAASIHKTRAGLVMGTPAYMSPEQCEGKGQVDNRCDIYSAGVVLYEMLTGKVPFPGEGFGEVLVAHMTRPAPLPTSLRPDIPPALEAIVMHAIEKKKERRFQSMEELSNALRDPDGHLAAYRAMGGPDAGRAAPMAAANSGAATMILSDANAGSFNLPASPASGGNGQATAILTAPLVPGGPGQPTAILMAPELPAGGGMAAAAGPRSNVQGRSTTLSGASGELDAAPARSGGARAVAFVLVGLVVGGAGLGGFLFLQHKKEQEAAAVAAAQAEAAAMKAKAEAEKAAAEAAEDAKLHVLIDTKPSGAKVLRAGHAEPVGSTPYDLTVKKDDPDFDVVLKLDGYKDEVKTVSTRRSHDMLIVLTKAEPEAPVADAKEKTKPHKSAHKGDESGGLFAPVGDSPKPKKKKPIDDGGGDGTLKPSW